jgi:putative ATP-dependent endonuclease of the OLD family
LYLSELAIRNFRQFSGSERPFSVALQPGVTALVGENDCGKTAIVDAIRYSMLTRDLDYIRVQPDDFHIDGAGEQATEITIRCKLSDLSTAEKAAFAEHLTYEGSDASLFLYWRARRLVDQANRRLAEVSVRSGPDGIGPAIELAARHLLEAAYLRPLRDAEREMSPGQGSRLSRVLNGFSGIQDGGAFDAKSPPENLAAARGLSLSAMAEYFRHLVNQHPGVNKAEEVINQDYLSRLALSGEELYGRINYTHGGSESARLRQVLERLELDLRGSQIGSGRGRYGLGSNNLMYMACELLLLGKDTEGLPLLLVEEPEAHLHPQRQLRLMEFLTSAAERRIGGSRGVQVILTTHSPNLSSKVHLDNLVLVEKQRAFPLNIGATRLKKDDYRFLERFLDSTRANLFFARGLIIVEGDAEAILIPTLARMIGHDLTAHGVSIVNVGGTGLRRYARILQRAEGSEDEVSIPVSCVADMDVMPDCAPRILGLVESDDDPKWTSSFRRWRAHRDFGNTEITQEDDLASRRKSLAAGDHANVHTFVADHWTFEYDLAFAGLAEDVLVAAALAEQDQAINAGTRDRAAIESAARSDFQSLQGESGGDREKLCATIYSRFVTGSASKAVAAQYLAEVLEARSSAKAMSAASSELTDDLPEYLVAAIRYSTGSRELGSANHLVGQ